MGECQCFVCRYVRKEITKEEAIKLVKADIKAEKKERRKKSKDRWITEENLEFDRMFLSDLMRGDK